jgi:hypothetical protein
MPDASGGGCSCLIPIPGGNFNVCAGSPSRGVAQPDIYFHFTKSNPACRIQSGLE